MLNVQVKHLPGNQDIPLPTRMSAAASGFDLYAAVSDPVVIQPLTWELIPTGIALQMPDGLEAQIRPRSGLALKHGITILNGPGTIDADYRGEIGVLLYNASGHPYTVQRKDRIAQLVFSLVPKVSLSHVEQLEPTSRGMGGFGHTGR